MSIDHRVFTDIFKMNDIVQQVCSQQPKNLLIDHLRELFRGDSEYPFVTDQYGFPVIPDIPETEDTDPLPLGENGATAIIIRDTFAMEPKMFPSIVVRHSGGSYDPVSFNQNDGTITYDINCYLDQQGFRSFTRVPRAFTLSGAWDLSFDIIISAEDITTLEELTDIVSVGLMTILRDRLRENGLFIRNISLGGENDEQYTNDYIHTQVINVSARGEWRREIPIANIIETVIFSIGVQNFGNIDFPDNPTQILHHIGGKNIVGNDLDIITIAGDAEDISTADLNITNTEQGVANNL